MKPPKKKAEPPLMQEIGPKKYYERVDAAHKFYDQHKAGKRDPKTGELYHHISFKDPTKRTVTGQSLCQVECHDCGNPFSVRTTTVALTCGSCGCYHSFDYNRDTGELKIQSKPKGKP